MCGYSVIMLVATILLSGFVVTILADHHNFQHNQVQHCADFKPQQWVEIDKLLGKWYATEVIFHSKDENELVKYHNECPILFLKEILPDPLLPTGSANNFMDNINFRHQEYQPNTQNQEDNVNWDELIEPLLKVWKEANRGKHRNDRRRTTSTTTILPNTELEDFKKQTLQRLRLVWNEEGTRLEYSLRYNESRPGYWMSFGSQNNSMYDQYGYTPFIGTIQILKAIRTHTVLTFCHISLKHQFFSVVISREPWVNKTDVEHIHHMLERKQLPIRHIRRMCMEYRNSARGIYGGMIILVLSSFFLLLSRHVITNS